MKNLTLLLTLLTVAFSSLAAENCARKRVVACVGDSITYGHGASNRKVTSYPAKLQSLLGNDWVVTNLGHNARTAINEGMEWNKAKGMGYCKSPRYKQSLECRPDYVIFMLGTNDSKGVNWDEEVFRRDYTALVDSYLALDPKPVVIIGISPFVKKDSFSIREKIVGGSIAPWQREFAAKRSLPAVDAYSVMKENAAKGYLGDGVHPNDTGYAALAEAFAAKIKSLEK